MVGGPRVYIGNITELKTTVSTGPRTVQATISTDNPSGGQTGIQSAELLYSLDSGKTFETIPMEYIREQIISADIPGQPPGTYVIYKIKATEIEEYSFEFDGSSLSSGMFFYILSAQENILTRKCCYLK